MALRVRWASFIEERAAALNPLASLGGWVAHGIGRAVTDLAAAPDGVDDRSGGSDTPSNFRITGVEVRIVGVRVARASAGSQQVSGEPEADECEAEVCAQGSHGRRTPIQNSGQKTLFGVDSECAPSRMERPPWNGGREGGYFASRGRKECRGTRSLSGWRRAMATGDSDRRWWRAMATGDGGGRWWRAMATGDGDGVLDEPWCEMRAQGPCEEVLDPQRRLRRGQSECGCHRPALAS